LGGVVGGRNANPLVGNQKRIYNFAVNKVISYLRQSTLVRDILIGAFWMGVTLFILGQLISFSPAVFFGTEWFAVSAILCLCGLLVRRRSYSIGALFLVLICIAFSIWEYQRVMKYHGWQSRPLSREEQIYQLEWGLETNAEPSRTVK